MTRCRESTVKGGTVKPPTCRFQGMSRTQHPPLTVSKGPPRSKSRWRPINRGNVGKPCSRTLDHRDAVAGIDWVRRQGDRYRQASRHRRTGKASGHATFQGPAASTVLAGSAAVSHNLSDKTWAEGIFRIRPTPVTASEIPRSRQTPGIPGTEERDI